MIGSLGIGGSQSFVMSIYRKIDKSKVQFDFIIDHPEMDYYAEEIESLGGKIYRFNSFNGRNYHSLKKKWDSFFTLHPEYKILHCHVRSYSSIFIPIAKKHGIKVVIHSHNDSNGRGFKALIKNILQLPLRFECDYYMACSQKAGRWLFGNRICSTDRFMVVKNAIDTNTFLYNEKSRNKIRRKFNIADKFVLGFVARVTEQKNPLFVIEVMKELLRYDKDAVLLFVGDGELLERTKEKALKYGINNSIIFTGAQTEIGEILSAIDYYVLPSSWEGFGISLIEAEASGVNCICSLAIQPEALIIKEGVKQIDVALGARRWADEIVKTHLNDRSMVSKKASDIIKLRGFDIADNTNFFLSFYHEIIGAEE